MIPTASFSQDVRKLIWGMTREKVKETEGVHQYESDKTKDGFDYIYYIGKANGLECILAFYFVDNKLFRVRYLFTEKHSTKNLYVDDFVNVESTLEDKYGKATIEKSWTDDLYKDNFNDWGMALAIGHLTMYTSRNLEKTEIYHEVSGDNYDISHTLSFKSLALNEIVSKKAKEAKKDDF